MNFRPEVLIFKDANSKYSFMKNLSFQTARRQSNQKGAKPSAMSHKRCMTYCLAFLLSFILFIINYGHNYSIVRFNNSKSSSEITPITIPDEEAAFEIPFEKREDIPCPNNCSSFLTASNKCDDDTELCACGADFFGADCSFLSNKECVVVLNDVLRKVKGHYSIHGGYDGLPQAHAHIILANQVLQNKVPGDVVELGVFKGGSASVLVNVFESCSSKKFWLYDSFAGHPAIDLTKNPGMAGWEGKHIGTLEEAKANVQALNPSIIIDYDRIIWKKGFFNRTLKETLPNAIAYLHIDCDWYECLIETLDALYDRVSWGGVIILDDVGFYGFARAGLMEWTRKRNIVPALRSTFGVGDKYGGGSHFWVKGYQGYHNQPKAPLWPGGARPAFF